MAGDSKGEESKTGVGLWASNADAIAADEALARELAHLEAQEVALRRARMAAAEKQSLVRLPSLPCPHHRCGFHDTVLTCEPWRCGRRSWLPNASATCATGLDQGGPRNTTLCSRRVTMWCASPVCLRSCALEWMWGMCRKTA